MSYTAKEWVTGDDINISDLNNMEEGIDNAANPFVVTLTPTAQDFSGTMDKTVAEITAAIQAGRRVIYRIYTSQTEYTDAEATMTYTNTSYTYPSINAFILTANPFDALIFAHTGAINDGTRQTYSTTIYPLTPMS